MALKKNSSADKLLPASMTNNLLNILKIRFEENMNRHDYINWNDVEEKLKSLPEKMWSLNRMEETGGEPDVFGYDTKSGEYIFFDFSIESPKGRRSLCYDSEAFKSRKENKPKNSAFEMACEMGINILTEKEYFELQKTGGFDLKTSSWLYTPGNVRELGGAIFGDNRFGRVFIYHNGAESYYAARGFRGSLKV
ncbi:MAG: DUF4256 domain-containing protein [Chitinophagaceae bacterium]|nr:DUF4256 domain-containing protein [Chitinophagaceae bacterium]